MTPEQERQFGRFERLLLGANQEFNLTRITEHQEVLVKHFLDSLTCLLALDFPVGARVVDVGSGGGFPGIPLTISRADLRMTLIEASQKKAVFLEATTRRLGLDGVEVVGARAEDVARQARYREAFDVAVARAVGHLATLAEVCLPLVRVGGWFVAMKGPEGETEADEAALALTAVGGRMAKAVKVSLPGGGGARTLVVVAKEAGTPEKYPRKAGIPQKRPLGRPGPGRTGESETAGR